MSGASAPRQLARGVRFVLLRHGEAEGNRELRYLGSGAAGDAALTARGAAQAQQAARALANYPLVAIYASPLRRAWLTASALADATGLTPQAAPELREQNYGAWEGLTRAEAQARDPALHAAWEAGDDGAPPDGESAEQLRTRVIAYADALATQRDGALTPEQLAPTTPTIALVSHVGPIKALIAAALGLAPAEARRLLARMWLDPASVSVVDWRPSVARNGGDAESDVVSVARTGTSVDAPRGLLRVFNATDHLDPPPRWRGRG